MIAVGLIYIYICFLLLCCAYEYCNDDQLQSERKAMKRPRAIGHVAMMKSCSTMNAVFLACRINLIYMYIHMYFVIIRVCFLCVLSSWFLCRFLIYHSCYVVLQFTSSMNLLFCAAA